MKKIIFLASLVYSLSGYAQSTSVSLKNIMLDTDKKDIPVALLTDKDSYWTVSGITTSGYANNSVKDYSVYNAADAGIMKFKFLKNNRFEFLTYTPGNIKSNTMESWTTVNGTVMFLKDARGQQVFTTMADKGVHRIVKNGAITISIIPAAELKARHSNTYLWESASFQSDPGKNYLLMVNMDEHPGVDINQPNTINPAWIEKFNVPGSR